MFHNVRMTSENGGRAPVNRGERDARSDPAVTAASTKGGGGSGALRARILAYLAEHNVMTVATAEPWAAAVFYVNDGLALYFLSSPRSRHCTNLVANPRVAITIHEDYADWREIKGVQLEGIAAPVVAGDEARVRALYGAKFPVIHQAQDTALAIAQALARIRWYQVVPRRIHFIDNASGFGHRDSLDLEPTWDD